MVVFHWLLQFKQTGPRSRLKDAYRRKKFILWGDLLDFMLKVKISQDYKA